MDAAVRALEAAGRRVIEVREVESPGLRRRFDAAKAALAAKNPNAAVRTRRLYHGTTVAAAEAIAIEGFRVDRTGPRTGAFGTGVNLTPDVAHTLLYSARGGPSCLVVCDAAIAKMHATRSRRPRVDAGGGTVPDHVRPMAGFDAMYGASGKIVVVPCCARVLPRWVIRHAAK